MGLRERRLHRRKLRLTRAIGIAEEAILHCGSTDASEAAITLAAKAKAKDLCGNPILIAIVIQLIPILVKLFLNSASEAQFADRCNKIPDEISARLSNVDNADQCLALSNAIGADAGDWMRAIALILRVLADVFDWFNE